jgi:hypothetical protein
MLSIVAALLSVKFYYVIEGADAAVPEIYAWTAVISLSSLWLLAFGVFFASIESGYVRAERGHP